MRPWVPTATRAVPVSTAELKSEQHYDALVLTLAATVARKAPAAARVAEPALASGASAGAMAAVAADDSAVVALTGVVAAGGGLANMQVDVWVVVSVPLQSA